MNTHWCLWNRLSDMIRNFLLPVKSVLRRACSTLSSIQMQAKKTTPKYFGRCGLLFRVHHRHVKAAFFESAAPLLPPFSFFHCLLPSEKLRLCSTLLVDSWQCVYMHTQIFWNLLLIMRKKRQYEYKTNRLLPCWCSGAHVQVTAV